MEAERAEAHALMARAGVEAAEGRRRSLERQEGDAEQQAAMERAEAEEAEAARVLAEAEAEAEEEAEAEMRLGGRCRACGTVPLLSSRVGRRVQRSTVRHTSHRATAGVGFRIEPSSFPAEMGRADARSRVHGVR